MQVLVLCLTLILAVSAQPNCTDLGFGDYIPAPGDNLPICVQSELQCCSEAYLNIVRERLRDLLQTFLADEFEAVFEMYSEGVENLIDYFDEDFTENLFDNLPFSGFVNASSRGIRDVLDSLADNYEIDDDDEDGDSDDDDFDVGDFVQNLLDSSVDAIAVTEDASSTIQCIERVFNSLINRDAIQDMTLRIQEIRRAITALRRVQEFLDEQEDRLEDAIIPESCVELFIENAFCSRCTQLTPPLCLATCNAIVRGCYSPYYTVLNNQYQELWNEVRNIIDIANTTVQDIIQGEAELIDIEDLFDRITSECGTTMISQPTFRRRRQVNEEDSDDEQGSDLYDSSSDSSSDGMQDQFIPAALVEGILQLDGAFQYAQEGLLFCLDALVEPSKTPNVTKYCTGEEICTSDYLCTDGIDLNAVNNETLRTFDLNGVASQGLNPVYAGNVEDLQTTADMLGNENPVAAFLSSDEFTEVIPEVINDDEQNSATGLAISTITILLVALVAFL